jgi:hypothetical protein
VELDDGDSVGGLSRIAGVAAIASMISDAATGGTPLRFADALRDGAVSRR